MTARITISKSISRRLEAWLISHPQGHERGAFVLFRKLNRPVDGLPESPRYVAVDLFELTDEWVVDSSPGHLHFSMRCLPALYHRCEQEDLHLGFVHSHPAGSLYFSAKDDQNERTILRGYAGANGMHVELVALVYCAGEWLGRLRLAGNIDQPIDVRHVIVLDDGLAVHAVDAPEGDEETLARQEAAFGRPFNAKMGSLRAVVVGSGGTGSPTAILLARSGIGELVIIDGDTLAKSNLNRVRGFGAGDVGNNKAETLAAYIRGLGLGTKVSAIPDYLDRSARAVDALSSADIVFGCTDDVAGRDVLGQAVYYYCVPLIDVGLTGRIDLDPSGHPYLRDHRGRISTILPEQGACLRCQGVVTEEKLKYERALKERPELADVDADRLREEFYLVGGGEAAPGVGPFTGTVADLSVATFMNLVRPYRDLPPDFRPDNLWIDFVHLSFYSNSPKGQGECFCCGPDGLFNRRERGCRLDMPALGKL